MPKFDCHSANEADRGIEHIPSVVFACGVSLWAIIASIRQVIFAYKRSEGISKKLIISAIQNQKLRTVALDNCKVLIDKIALQ